jgi:hypothetical protein
MSRLPVGALVALSLAVACAGAPEAPEVPEMISPLRVLPNIAIPPGGEVTSTEGGPDAASLLISTPLPADSVVMFYRDVLGQPPYRLINEAVTGRMTTFYVEQETASLWVTVEGLEAGGTFVRLGGAAVKPASDTTGGRGAGSTPSP